MAYTIHRADPALRPDAGSPGRDDLDMLLEATGCGNHHAFDLVFGELFAPVYGAIRSVLHDPAQAEEVAQEVLLEIWQIASRYDASLGGAKAWVLTIARRRAIDRVRSAASAATREQRTATMPFLDQVSDIVEDTMECERLRRCLDSLSNMQREAIVLVFYGEFTHLQVASMLDVPLGTAKSRIRDGLIKLRNGMQDDTSRYFRSPGRLRPKARNGVGRRNAAPGLKAACSVHKTEHRTPAPPFSRRARILSGIYKRHRAFPGHGQFPVGWRPLRRHVVYRKLQDHP